MAKKQENQLSPSRFRDTILRTLFIMIVAVIFTRILDFPVWVTIVLVLAGIAVIIHAVVWIRRLQDENENEIPEEK